MSLAYENLVKENKTAFIAKVKQISANLGIDPNWLMIVMRNESGLNHRIKNSIGCVGLIQFCTSTPRALGTSAEALVSMSNVEQLSYVEKYYQSKEQYLNDYTDLYLCTFLPAYLGMPDSFVIPEKYYAANNLVNRADFDKDKKVTIGEWRKATRALVPQEYQKFVQTVFWTKPRKKIVFFGVLLILIGGIWYCKENKLLFFKEN